MEILSWISVVQQFFKWSYAVWEKRIYKYNQATIVRLLVSANQRLTLVSMSVLGVKQR